MAKFFLYPTPQHFETNTLVFIENNRASLLVFRQNVSSAIGNLSSTPLCSGLLLFYYFRWGLNTAWTLSVQDFISKHELALPAQQILCE